MKFDEVSIQKLVLGVELIGLPAWKITNLSFYLVFHMFGMSEQQNLCFQQYFWYVWYSDTLCKLGGPQVGWLAAMEDHQTFVFT